MSAAGHTIPTGGVAGRHAQPNRRRRDTTMRTRIDGPLLRKAMAKVEELPDPLDVTNADLRKAWAQGQPVEVWNQTSWGYRIVVTVDAMPVTCGTAGCIAYWTAVLAGGQIVFEGDYAGHVQVDGQTLVPIDSYARNALGLTVEEASELFFGENTRADLREVVDVLLARADEQMGRP